MIAAGLRTVGSFWRPARHALAATALLALTACGGDEEMATEPPPTKLDLTITAAPDVNPDPTGRASPIAVKVLMLTTPGRFNSTQYDPFWADEATALGQELVKVENFMMQPGEVRVYTAEVSDSVNYIGIAGAYRAIDTAVWRNALPVERQTTMDGFALLQSSEIWLTLGNVNRSGSEEAAAEGPTISVPDGLAAEAAESAAAQGTGAAADAAQ